MRILRIPNPGSGVFDDNPLSRLSSVIAFIHSRDAAVRPIANSWGQGNQTDHDAGNRRNRRSLHRQHGLDLCREQLAKAAGPQRRTGRTVGRKPDFATSEPQ